MSEAEHAPHTCRHVARCARFRSPVREGMGCRLNTLRHPKPQSGHGSAQGTFPKGSLCASMFVAWACECLMRRLACHFARYHLVLRVFALATSAPGQRPGCRVWGLSQDKSVSVPKYLGRVCISRSNLSRSGLNWKGSCRSGDVFLAFACVMVHGRFCSTSGFVQVDRTATFRPC